MITHTVQVVDKPLVLDLAREDLTHVNVAAALKKSNAANRSALESGARTYREVERLCKCPLKPVPVKQMQQNKKAETEQSSNVDTAEIEEELVNTKE